MRLRKRTECFGQMESSQRCNCPIFSQRGRGHCNDRKWCFILPKCYITKLRFRGDGKDRRDGGTHTEIARKQPLYSVSDIIRIRLTFPVSVGPLQCFKYKQHCMFCALYFQKHCLLGGGNMAARGCMGDFLYGCSCRQQEKSHCVLARIPLRELDRERNSSIL